MEVAVHQSVWHGVARQLGTDRPEARPERAESLDLRRIQGAGEHRWVLQQRVGLRWEPFEAAVQAPYRQQVALPCRHVSLQPAVETEYLLLLLDGGVPLDRGTEVRQQHPAMLLVDAQRRGDVVGVEPGQAAHHRRLVREQRQAGRGLLKPADARPGWAMLRDLSALSLGQ